MIGEKHAAVTPENADACGELLNIIYASARVKINEAGFDFQPAIPTTVSGSRISLPLGQYSSFIKFTAESPHGPLTLALALKRAE
jgi:CheY-specific phosphatase CheX